MEMSPGSLPGSVPAQSLLAADLTTHSAEVATSSQTHSLPASQSPSTAAVNVTRASTAPHTRVLAATTTSTTTASTTTASTTTASTALTTQVQVHVAVTHASTLPNHSQPVVSQSSTEDSQARGQPASGQTTTQTTTNAMLTQGKVSAGMTDLTPVVSVYTPFPMQFDIPKLDLSGLSKTLDSTPTTTRTSTGWKINPPTLSGEFKHHSATHPLAQTTRTPTTTATSIGSSPMLASAAPPVSSRSGPRSPDMEPGLQQSGLDSGLSSGIELRLESQYWKHSGSSTLMFPELSAATLSPPPTEVGSLSAMPTPSMAFLSGGFNASSQDGSFLTSLLGSLPTTSLTQQSALEASSRSPMFQHSPLAKTSPAPQTVVTASTTSGTHGQATTTAVSQLSGLASPPTSTHTPATTAREKKSRHSTSPLAAQSTPKSGAPTSQLSKSTQPQMSSSSSITPPLKSATPQTTAQRRSDDEGGSAGKVRTPRKQRPPSPRMETAKKMLTQLKETLDATQFDADTYLSSLKEERGDVAVAQPSAVAAERSLVSKQVTKPPSPIPPQTVSASSKPIVSHSTTAVTQTSEILLSMASYASATSTTTSTSSVFLHLSPSPQKTPRPPTTTTPSAAPSATGTQVTVSSGGARLFSSGLEQSDSATLKLSEMEKEVVQKTRKSERQVQEDLLEKAEQQQQQQQERAAMRSVGVGTTPGLRRTQAKSTTLTHTASSHRTEKASVPFSKTSDSSVSVATTQQGPPKSVSPARIKKTKSQSISPQKQSPSSSSQSPAASATLPSSSEQEYSPSRPIYTSPRLHPHTSSLSPPPQSHSQPLTCRERRKTPEPNALKVPDSLCFRSPCCVGVTLSDQLQITNVGDRWLQLSFQVQQVYCNGTSCPSTDTPAFSFPQRCFVSPRKTESIKLIFAPTQEGNYEAVLVCMAQLVINSEDDSNSLSENVVLKALAVLPRLEVATPPRASGAALLDYGVLVSGSALSLPLHLANHGTSELPLRLAISAPTLAQLYFSFEELHPSLQTTPASPSSYLHTRPFSTTLVLPPKPAGKSKKPEVYLVEVNFKSPKRFADDASPLGPPEEINAQVNISVEGPNSSGTLCSVPIKAVVGVARLHVPRSLQALTLSCSEKRGISREVPFKNAGNIPLQITLKFSANCNYFLVDPSSLQLSPGEETQVTVSFSPPTSPLTIDGYLVIHVEPNGPSYELKLRGTAAKEDDSGGPGGREDLLFCNKRLLYWGGVDPGNSVEQKLLLQNSYASAVPLNLSIRHQDQAFQLLHSDPLPESRAQTADLPPRGQLQLPVLFTPPSESVFRNALDIYDTAHSKKFRIPLCGYGGVSVVEVVNARRSTTQGLWVDLGPVSTRRHSTTKISLYNSGLRAAFVTALCYPLDEEEGVSPLPASQASVNPAQFVLHPQQMQDLEVAYQPGSSEEEAKCLEVTAPLARLVLLNGDEIVRQRFQRAVTVGSASSKTGEETGQGEDRGATLEGRKTRLANTFYETFLQPFPGQESVPSELDFSSFEVENEEKFFEQHIQQITVTLSGSPMSETPLPRRPHQPLSTSFDSPPKALHTLSPSHTFLLTPPTTGPAHRATPTLHITSSDTLMLPNSAVGQFSGEMTNYFVHNMRV